MADPRQLIENLMIENLALIGPANGDDVPFPIWQVTTKELPISAVPAEFRPTIVFLTEQGESTFLGLGGIQQTVLSVAVLLYLNIRPIDEGSVVCTQYSKAVRHCFAVHREWGGLALVTEITGVPTHQLLTIPDAIVTVFADVTYMHEDKAA